LRAVAEQRSNRDLKQTGRQRDDDGYSHNDIPNLVQKKLIIKSPTGVRDVVLGLSYNGKPEIFTSHVQRKHVKTRQVKLQICSAEAFLTIKPLFLSLQTELNSYMHAVDNTQQLFFAIIYLKKFVLAVVVALPLYMHA
jgi:hypothetical protein